MAKDLVQILPDYAEKLGNMGISAAVVRDAESANYAHYMAKALAYSEAQREENKKLAEIRKQRRGIDPTAQQPSTLATLARPKEDDEKHFFRPIPKEVIEQSAKLAAAIQENDVEAIKDLQNERMVTPEEISHIEATRRRPKNSKGQSEKKSIDTEKREVAVHAFTFSPGIEFSELTQEEKQRITQIVPYSEPQPIEKEEEIAPTTVAGKLRHWLWKKGVPVQRLTKKEFKVND